MIESKELITGEVQGTSEPKFVVLTEEEITKMMKKAAREGAKEGIAAYESKQAVVMAERTEKVRNSAKTLVQHYRQLKKMKDTSVYDPDTVTDLFIKISQLQMMDTVKILNPIQLKLFNHNLKCSLIWLHFIFQLL